MRRKMIACLVIVAALFISVSTARAAKMVAVGNLGMEKYKDGDKICMPGYVLKHRMNGFFNINGKHMFIYAIYGNPACMGKFEILFSEIELPLRTPIWVWGKCVKGIGRKHVEVTKFERQR